MCVYCPLFLLGLLPLCLILFFFLVDLAYSGPATCLGFFCLLSASVDVNRISFSFSLKYFDEGHDACNVLVTTVRRCILAQSFINLVAGQN